MKIRSIQGLFGQTIHYDENGNKVGESWPGLFTGSLEHYNDVGEHVGHSERGFIEDLVHYDSDNNCVGSSERGLFGSTHHYDSDGYVGSTYESIFDSVTDVDSDFF